TDADPESVRQVAEPETIDHRGQRETQAHDDRAGRDYDSRAESVREMARDRAEEAPHQHRDREHRRGCAAARAELRRHWLEERAEAVGDGIRRAHRNEGGRYHPPRARRVEQLETRDRL